jgi:hypothetical protein
MSARGYKIEFVLPAKHLSTISANGARMAEPGEFEISVGGRQPGATNNTIRAALNIGGSAKEVN